MMQETFLPFWRQEDLQEQETAFPPSLAFNLEPRNDDNSVVGEAESDLSASLLPSSNEPASDWKQSCRSKAAFAAKLLILGTVLFAATALVVNLAVLVGGKIVGSSHQGNLPLTLTLFLDEATAKRITSVDQLAQIFDMDADDTGVMALRWPQNQKQDQDCPHCGEIDDDDDDGDGNADVSPAVSVLEKSRLGEARWVMQLRISKTDSNDDDSSETSNRVSKNLRSSSRGDGRWALSSSTASVNSAFEDSEKLLMYELEQFLCGKIKAVFPETFQEAVGSLCQLEHLDGMVMTEKKKIGTSTIPLGNDRDEHGCIASAGYSWCQALNQCHRPWETVCESSNGDRANDLAENSLVGNDRDEHGCDRSAGYSWCETSNSCHREWESRCDGDSDQTKIGEGNVGVIENSMVGNDRDEHGCDRSAGYSWCETSNSCHREWETACGKTANDNDNNGVDVLLTIKAV